MNLINSREDWEKYDGGRTRNPDLFFKDAWKVNWPFAYFDNCFPGKNAIGDIDGIIELGHNFLVTETKNCGEKIPTGQNRMFEAMNKTGNFTILVIWGKPLEPEKALIFFPDGKKKEENNVNLEWMENFYSRWATWAKGNGNKNK